MTRPEGFLPTSDAVPVALELRVTLPGKSKPHELWAIATISVASLKGGNLPDLLEHKLALMRLTVLEHYREAQEAE